MRRTARSSIRLAIVAPCLLAAGACAHAPPAAAPSPQDDTAARITKIMTGSAAAWNRGDLDAFVGDYAEDATFVTSRGLVHGRDAIRAVYQTAYWRDGAPRDGLRYEDLDVRRVAPTMAIAFGHYVLYDRDSGEQNATGSFSLTFLKAGERWEIVHDHSS